MRRAIYFLLCVVTVFCFGSVQPVLAAASDFAKLALDDGPDRDQRRLPAAKAEGEVNVYTTLVVQDIADIAAAFEKKYGIKVKFWRAGSEKVLQRIVSEIRAGRFDFDVVETNGPELEALHREKMLQKASSPYLSHLIHQAIMPHGEWVGTRLNMFVQMYNTNLVKKEELPQSFQEFLDPKWKGRLGIEAEDLDWFATVVKQLGEEKGLKLFRDIVKTNGLSVRKGHTLLAGLVASGEVPFSLTVYNHNADKLMKKGAPVSWYAIKPAIVRVNGMGVSKKPAHPNAALLFYDFMLTDGQSLLAKAEYTPTSRKVNAELDKMDLKFVDPAMVLDESAKWQKLYEEIITRQGL